MTSATPALILYRLATIAFGPAAAALLAWRRRRGKEDPQRQNERLGFAGLPRPTGTLIWLHGASVGESVALLPLIERLAAKGLAVLVTTGTVSSAQVLARRLPGGAFHQYIPLDVPRFVQRFLDHWRPDLALITESELWPNMLQSVKLRRIPLLLINGRMSERSFARWQRLPGSIGAVLQSFDLCLMQTAEDAARLVALGAPHVKISGNLKYDVAAPPVDPVELAAHLAAVGPRPVWVAASTHPGEEAIAAKVHYALVRRLPSLLTIVVPRHPQRGAEIESELAASGANVSRRSAGARLDRATQIYIADTIGETGLFYRLSTIAFLGRSLTGRGGQNPIEPAKLGAAILHGPNIGNFREVYAELDDAEGSLEVADAPALIDAVGHLLEDVAAARAMARAAKEAVERLGGATNIILEAMQPFLPPTNPGAV